ncbi:hypothetical protein ECAE60S_04260 [Eoetvoesiella caeni]
MQQRATTRNNGKLFHSGLEHNWSTKLVGDYRIVLRLFHRRNCEPTADASNIINHYDVDSRGLSKNFLGTA